MLLYTLRFVDNLQLKNIHSLCYELVTRPFEFKFINKCFLFQQNSPKFA